MFRIGNRLVGGSEVFIIAEIGINHNGSLELAKQLIEAAAEMGCDAVKFQKRTVPVVYSSEELAAPRQVDPSIIQAALDRRVIEGVQYIVLPEENIHRLEADITKTTNGDLKYALEFNSKEYDMIAQWCKQLGIMWSASPWDGQSVPFLAVCPFIKVASATLTHRNLLERIRALGKPVIISTGGSTMAQVETAIEILGRENLAILHCVAEYPPADEAVNLKMIDSLRLAFPGVPIGYSGHQRDILASVAAVVRGASIIEMHLTLDRNLPGSDHKASLEPSEFAQMVKEIRRIEKMLGDGAKKVTSVELEVMKKLRRKTDF